ncbi:MAG: SLC13 family permease [Syntrophales bacterium]|jgi:di/tricarboxylate transporter|nr:SLC13 family permease [Syntrophales bacterium]
MTFPYPPNVHALTVLASIVLALILFSRKELPVETTSLLILTGLTVGFELFPFRSNGQILHATDFFRGFGHEALISVCALMIAGQGLVRTGALEPIGRLLSRLWKASPSLSLLLTLILAAVVSAFVNNTPVVVLLLPILIGVSLRTGVPASSLLMPMGFATILGGTSTVIGTSTNLLVVSVARDMGLARIGMFDFLLPAALAGAIGILYLWLLAPRLLPKRALSIEDDSPRVFVAHLAILDGSPVLGATLGQAVEMTGGAMHVMSVERGPDNFIPVPSLILKSGDHLVIQDTPKRLKEFETVLEGTLYPAGSEDKPIDEAHPLKAEDQQIAEIAVTAGSFLQGTTLSELRFGERYGLITLALRRVDKHWQMVHGEIGNAVLEVGDILLVQGPREKILNIKKEKEVIVLDATVDLPFTGKAKIALLVMAGIVLAAAQGALPIAISATFGAFLMILTGGLRWRDAAMALNTQVILIIVASLALGEALLKTGGADYLAGILAAFALGAPPALAVSGLMLSLAVLTNMVSNNAAAVIGTPIAVSLAAQMGQPPELFVLAVLFGANMSFATPMGYKTNLLVMSAGEYRFADFVRVGLPLVLLMWGVLSLVLPLTAGLR